MFKFNSNQSPSKSESDSEDSDVTHLSVTDIENIIGIKQIETFEWTTELENCLLLNMVELKSSVSGINKHLSAILLKERISKELKINIPMNVLSNYLSTKWNIRAADIIERIIFGTSEKEFALPEEDMKQINEKTSNQSKDVEKIEKISNFRGRKRRSSNVSESSFSSNNSKPGRYDKNKLTDLTILDSSSRSVTPQILSGKTSNRSVTSETISRKSNLRSCNKDQKSKLLTHSENEANN